ncbi:MAG: hypothetical protein ACOYEP_04395 [Limnochordia bacterium]
MTRDVVGLTSAQLSGIVKASLLTDLRPSIQRYSLSESDFIPVSLIPVKWEGALVGLPTEINAVIRRRTIDGRCPDRFFDKHHDRK